MAGKLKPLWLLVLAGGLILALNMGIRQTFGLYLGPISRDLELGREIFALSMGLLNLVWGLTAPVAGGFADRFGAGKVIAAGGLLYAAGLYVLAAASSEVSVISAGLLLGLGVSGTGFTAVLGAAGRAAPEGKRSMVLGLVSMGSSIGQFAALPFAHVLIQETGWPVSLLLMALVAAMMAPLGWIISARPPQPALLGEQSLSAALRQAIAHRGFLLLTAGFFVCGFHIAFVAVHLPSFLVDRSFGPEMGVIALTVIGFTNIIGTYLCGWAGEIMEKRVALTMLYLSRAFVFLGFLLTPLTGTTVLVYSALLGLLWLGTIPLTSGLVATLFGPRWMSMLFGVVFLSHQIGSFLGAWLGGYLYDMLQSYEVMWWLSAGLGFASAALHWPIRERPVTIEPAPASPR